MSELFDKLPKECEIENISEYDVTYLGRKGINGTVVIRFEDDSVERADFDISIIGNVKSECIIYSVWRTKQGDAFSVLRRKVLGTDDENIQIEYDAKIIGIDGTVVDIVNQLATINLSFDRCTICKDICNIITQSGCGAGLSAICTLVTGGLGIPICLGIVAILCHYGGKTILSMGIDALCKKIGCCP